MKLAIFINLFSGLALASLYGPDMSPAHQHNHLERDIPQDMAAQKPSILSKLAQIVPSSIVSAIQANPTTFSNSNPPEFWNQLTDEEKHLLAELYPAEGAEATTTVPCTSTTTTTITLTTTVPLSKSSVSAQSVTNAPYASASTSARPVFSFSAPLTNATSTQVLGTASATGNVTSTRPSAPAFTGKANAMYGNLVGIAMAAVAGVGFALLR